MKNRRKARELALQVLYQADIRGISLSKSLNIILSRYHFRPEVEFFCKTLVEGTEKFLPWLDKLIRTYAENWTLDRMAVVDRNILRFSIYELLLVKKIPSIVSINEAVEIAKRYGTSDSGKFVNGILDRIRRERSPDGALKWDYFIQKLHDPALNSFIKIKQKAKAYLVGGFIRDSLVGKESRDFDIVLDNPNFELAEKFAHSYNRSLIPLDNELRRVILPQDYQFDFALKKSSSIEDDLKRRDFTIDAMALDLDFLDYPYLCLIDIKRGLGDLIDGNIVLVYEKALQEDPLRMLKAFRLKSKLNFNIQENIINIILRDYELIDKVASERIREEIFLLLDNPSSSKYLSDYALKKLLEKKLEVPIYPENLQRLEEVLNPQTKIFFPLKQQLIAHLEEKIGGISRLQILKLLSLILSSSPNIHFIKKIPKLLKLSRKQKRLIKRITDLIPILEEVVENPSDPLKTSAFFSKAGKETVEICLAVVTSRPKDEIYLDSCEKILSTFFEKRSLILEPPKLVSGEELIQLLGIEPGPRVSLILEKIHEAQIAGKVNRKEEAIQLARQISSKE